MPVTSLTPERRRYLQRLSTLIRYWILTSTHHAGSGHPTSSLSSVELMVNLLFDEGPFRYDLHHPADPNNDRLIFSKGHASPLFYALWAAAGEVTEDELMTYRTFGSPLEGHPTRRFRFTDAATGSLGQGLSIGVGMALNAKYLDRLPYRTYVLLGDSEMAEGSQWEAIQLAAWYRLDNLVGVLDVNRLGQRGETMYGHDLDAYADRVRAFGWEAIAVENGHDHAQVREAYGRADQAQGKGRPVMIVARTIKGQGVSFLADADGWHGKVLDSEQLTRALGELGEVDHTLRGSVRRPETAFVKGRAARVEPAPLTYEPGARVATRLAYGRAVTRLGERHPNVVVLDAEVGNSTKAELFGEAAPTRFFEMFVAEQNMVGTATGLALRGKVPFVSTFAAFLTRAFDQIRMSSYSDANLKIVGSHAGVSIGPDGPSQMGLEDLALFRTVGEAAVLYPADAVATERLVEVMLAHDGLAYLRTTRMATPVIYDDDETFVIGGAKVLRSSHADRVTVVAAGVTVHEALQAYEQLRTAGIHTRVIDLYSVKPVDTETLRDAAMSTDLVITVEDHRPEGGIADAVRAALANVPTPIYSLAVRTRPQSGAPSALLRDQQIDARAIVDRVTRLAMPEGVPGV